MKKLLLIGGTVIALAAAARLLVDPGWRASPQAVPAATDVADVTAAPAAEASSLPADAVPGSTDKAPAPAGRQPAFAGIKRFERSIVDDSDQLVNGRRAGKTHQFEDDPAHVFEQRNRKYDPVVNGFAAADRRGPAASRYQNRSVSSNEPRAPAGVPGSAGAGLTDPQDIPRTVDPVIARLLAEGPGGKVVHTDFSRKNANVYTAMIRWGDSRPSLVIESGDPLRPSIRVTGARLVAPLPSSLLRTFRAEPMANGVRFVYGGRGPLELSIREAQRSAIVTIVDHGS